MKQNSIYIVGTGGYSAVITELAEDVGFRVEGYIDEATEKIGSEHNSRKVISVDDAISLLPNQTFYANSIGDNSVRVRLCNTLKEAGGQFPSLVHSRAYVSPSAQLGDGVYVSAMAAVLAESVVSEYSIVCSCAVLSHHSSIGSGSLIGVGAKVGAEANIGRRVLVGAGATVKSGGVRVGEASILGAGTVVIRDIEAHSLYVGIERSA